MILVPSITIKILSPGSLGRLETQLYPLITERAGRIPKCPVMIEAKRAHKRKGIIRQMGWQVIRRGAVPARAESLCPRGRWRSAAITMMSAPSATHLGPDGLPPVATVFTA